MTEELERRQDSGWSEVRPEVFELTGSKEKRVRKGKKDGNQERSSCGPTYVLSDVVVNPHSIARISTAAAARLRARCAALPAAMSQLQHVKRTPHYRKDPQGTQACAACAAATPTPAPIATTATCRSAKDRCLVLRESRKRSGTAATARVGDAEDGRSAGRSSAMRCRRQVAGGANRGGIRQSHMASAV